MVRGLGAYDSALMFSNAFRILLNKHMSARETGSYEDFALIVPVMVNGAFSCELFLKALLEAPIRGHKLYSDLFRKLDSPTSKEIETVVIECVKEKKRTIIQPEQFISNLVAIEKTFEEFRYFYEPKNGNETRVYNLDFLEVLVFSLRAICEQRFGTRPI